MLSPLETDVNQREKEFHAIFPTLNDRGKDNALCILRALDFAQSALRPAEEQQLLNQSKTED